MSIHILDSETINQIAAGEVVERPMSVVKELVENSIDAMSTSIVVEIKEGGRELIRVTDNGTGISRDDITNVFKRHATSKLNTADDLVGIRSLGFRGEAMSSISSISNVELITKTKDDEVGLLYKISPDEEPVCEEVGVPEGTTIIVQDLFFNTPARRKFMKSVQTEASYIVSFLEKEAMVRPDISFKLTVNGKVRLQTSGNGSLKDVIYSIYGKEIAGNIIEINEESESISVTGFVGKPAISRGNRSYENYWVNGRFISNDAINVAIEEAYKGFIMLHSFPFTALSFSIDGNLIDVNVHPAKREMRLSESERICSYITETIRSAITKSNIIPHVTAGKETKAERKEMISNHIITPNIKQQIIAEPTKTINLNNGNNRQIIKQAFEYEDDLIPEFPEGNLRDIEENKKIDEANKSEPEVNNEISNFIQETFSEVAEAPQIKIIGQLFKTYWLIESGDTFYMMDQHAAHEKVLFERMMKQIKENKTSSQGLTIPVVVNVNSETINLLDENKAVREILEKLGYAIEIFGSNSVKMNSVPAMLPTTDYRQMLTDILDGLTEKKNSGIDIGDTPELLMEKVASMSCKAAIKGNDAISYSEAEELIKEIMRADNPYNCPHGRPTLIAMSKYDVEKKFKRIV